MLKKAGVVVMLGVVLSCLVFSSAAAENAMMPRWTLITHVSNNLDIDSWGKISMFSRISAYSGVESVRITVYLQRLENDSWVTVQSSTEDFGGNMGLWTQECYVSNGYNYRLMTNFYAFQGLSQESTILISESKYY